MSYLGIFRLKSEKTLSYMKLAPSNFPKCKNFVQNKNFSNLGPKLPYLGIFRL